MNEREIQSLLALAAKRLHTTPEALRAAAENGDLQNIMGGQRGGFAAKPRFKRPGGREKAAFHTRRAETV